MKHELHIMHKILNEYLHNLSYNKVSYLHMQFFYQFGCYSFILDLDLFGFLDMILSYTELIIAILCVSLK